MAFSNFKKLIATSIAYKANNKAIRYINNEGNDVSDFHNPIVKAGTWFDKYLNTYGALLDYKINHLTGNAKLDHDSIDPSDYDIPAKINELINCGVVRYNTSSSVFERPFFTFDIGEFGEYMNPVYFKTYWSRFEQVGDKNLFADVQSFTIKDVTLNDLKCVVGSSDDMLVNNAEGSIDPEVSYAMHISLPIPNLSEYTPKSKDLSEEDVLLWLNK